MTFFRPSEKHKTVSPWWHIDSNGSVMCTQGLVLLTDTTRKTGGFVAVPCSHLHNEDVLRDLKSNGKSTISNYLPIDWSTQAMKSLFSSCGGAKLITAPAGSLTLWDSRLIHSNCHRLDQPSPQEIKAMGGFTRLGFYVCMLPRPLEDGQTKTFRARALSNLLLCNHWPVAPQMKPERLRYPYVIA